MANRSIKKEPIIFSFYAEKGGVGKTTMCITLAHILAEQKKRVLIYDCDAQRSLTTWVFGLDIEKKFDGDVNKFIFSGVDKNKPKTLYMQITENLISAEAKKINESLFLVPGDQRINKLDSLITFDETSNKAGFGIQNQVNEVTGKPYHAILKTAQEYKVDYEFLDLNPYSGTLNRCLLMSSNYLIIPTIPDFFSFEMMKNMIEILNNWNTATQDLIESTKKGKYPFPDRKPKFIGYILSRYHPYSITPTCDDKRKMTIHKGIVNERFAAKEEKWINKIKENAENITDNLQQKELAVNTLVYKNADRTSLLGCVREYRSLKNVSDEYHIPVPFLNRENIKKLSKDESSRIIDFRKIFEEIVNNIESIIKADVDFQTSILLDNALKTNINSAKRQKT